MNKIDKFLLNINHQIHDKDVFPRVFLIGGKAGHGKDTFAKYLKTKFESLGLSVLIFHNADYLKYIASAYLDWDGTKTPKNREMLQKLGTERFRKLTEDSKWVKCTDDVIRGLSNVYDIFIIPDFRFPNEYFGLSAEVRRRTETVYITRPNYNNGLNEEAKQHASEISLYGHMNIFKYIIKNQTLTQLEEEAAKLVELIRSKK